MIWQGEWKGWCYSREDALRDVQVLGSEASLGPPLWPALGTQSHGQEVILVSLLPPQAVLAPVAGQGKPFAPSQGKVPSDS